jgi:cytochrome c peroxidase
MGGQGEFMEPKLGIDVKPQGPDLVKPKLAALKEYQHSLANPAPKAGSFDAAAAKRGREVFTGAARCASCHSGAALSDDKLHTPDETGMEPTYAARSVSKKYRTTPLRSLWQHPPYFHDGKAADLAGVVDHYRGALKLTLTDAQTKDLVEYLKSI